MRGLFVLLTLVSGCAGEVAGGKADGPAVFAEACARCHGDAGKPPASNVAQLGVKDLTVTKLDRAHVEQQIRQGSANKIMPAFAGVLKEEQIAAVADYVLSLSSAK
jgi:mono/diheme cytochrome c family protein